MLHRLFITLGLAAGLSAGLGACGPGQAIDNAFDGAVSGSYDYESLDLALTPVAADSLAVAVIDDRPYVVNGEQSPGFVGTMPGRYRNTVPVKTSSGRPLAEIAAGEIAEAYARQGVSATAVPAPEGAAQAEILPALAATGAGRLLVLRISDWQTDGVVRVTESWEIEAAVHDRAGDLLGRRTARGRANIGTTSLEGGTGDMAVAAFSRRLEYLLNDPEITRALDGG